MICKLLSSDSRIPNQKLIEGQSFVIGRNRQCRIKNLKCSRSFCTVKLLKGKLYVHFNKPDNQNKKVLKTGEFLKGNGFCYKIIIKDKEKIIRENVTCQTTDEKLTWIEHDVGKAIIGFYLNGGDPSSKVASFDFDFTLICTKSGKTFPTNLDDWKLFHPKLPEYIQSISKKQFRFVIISNQKGVSTKKTNVAELKTKFFQFLEKIKVPCLILISTSDDIYRKPRIGLWDYFINEIQPSFRVDLKKSFYVGDAAGRKKSVSQKKADHSCSDLLFAENCSLNFLLPEEFFTRMEKNELNFERISSSFSSLNNCFKYNHSENSNHLLENYKSGEKIHDIKSILPSSKHCIIFCGIAASGKSSFFKNHLKPFNYVQISLDIQKSMVNCIKLLKESLSESKNCVIDNTNVDQESRKKWIQFCCTNNAVPIIFYFNVSLPHIFHNNKFRHLTKTSKSVPDVIIYTQNKKFQSISEDECEQIFSVNFVPIFTNQNLEKLYSLYLNEK